ncbi:MAG TPA: hypothetical protein PKY50_08885 [Candidatus Competibacter sp.]|nr:hypothetical protein [Candidatus Competibacter sp.]
MLFKVFDLAYVALRQGDAVGVQSFGGEQRWLAPRSGPGTSSAVIDGVYDLQPTLELPDYAEAVNRVMTRQRKRALIVLPTNLRDPAASFARSHDRPIFWISSAAEGFERLSSTPISWFDGTARCDR